MSKGYFDNCMTVEELEQEHKRLVIQLHPDRNPNDPDATAKFQEMQAQYEERKAELRGDYTKARKGRERREREERERRDKERKERERRKVEQVVEAARLNRQRSHREWKAGDYVYAVKLKGSHADLKMDSVLEYALKNGMESECVVLVEEVFTMSDESLFGNFLYQMLGGDIYGGWEVIQTADPASGVRKSKRVAKVVLFRSENYCVFGNPMGDQSISDYYLPCNYGTMFHSQLDTLVGRIAWERQEQERIEAERKAKLLAEQKPLIEEWSEKLIAISAGLSDRERQEVAVANLKTMLKAKVPGTTFKFRTDKYSGGYYDIQWEDGPTVDDVDAVQRLFDPCIKYEKGLTPWEERFGHVYISGFDRKMSVLTKAKILQQLGSVTDAFTTNRMDENVTVSEFDWMMLHLLVGIEVGNPDAKLCMSTMHADGRRTVAIKAAVNFVFNHSDYCKVTKTSKKSKQAA